MNDSSRNLISAVVRHPRLHAILQDYGMLLVLVLLCVLFSLLSIEQQFPTGAPAGRQVATRAMRSLPRDAKVLIVAQPDADDTEFATAAADALSGRAITVVSVIQGGPAVVRKAVQKSFEQSTAVDAVLISEKATGWTFWDKLSEFDRRQLISPRPVRWPNFLKLNNLLNVANQTAIYAIIAVGMTLVIVTGGIDLSVGSLVALAAVTTAVVTRDAFGGTEASWVEMLLACMVAILVCAAAGTINGLLVSRADLPPFIVTLGMMLMASGLAYRLSEGKSINDLPTTFYWLGQGRTGQIPHPIWLMFGLYGLGHLVLARTVFGRYVYAIGGNAEAARLAGVPMGVVFIAVYTLSGALAGLGGIVLASQLATGDPKFGLMFELDVIAAVVVGGTSLMGGRGKMLGTLIGAFIIAVIRNGMNLTGVHPFNQKIVLGAVLIAAVALDRWKRGRKTT